MMTLRYQVAGLALDGSAPPGRQMLTITAGHLPLARATSDHRRERPGVLQRRQDLARASVTAHRRRDASGPCSPHPAGAFVTLRTTARDAAGGSITETITRAYATKSPT